MSQVETPSPDRNLLRRQIVFLPAVINENPPEKWWPGLARGLLRMEKNLDLLEDPILRRHVALQVDTAKEVLKKTAKLTIKDPLAISALVKHELMDISMAMAAQFEPDDVIVKSHFIPLPKLLRDCSGEFRAEDKSYKGIPVTEFSVRHPQEDCWDNKVLLPKSGEVIHKGGSVREVLNRVANAPLSMQISEYTRSDLDVITIGNSEENYRVAIVIGVDPEGVEYMGEKHLNINNFYLGRDTDQNQACLGADGLYFSQAAFDAAQTGHINLVGSYIRNKAIYGIDRIIVDGVPLAKPRGLMRLVKPIVEGKALSFDYLPVNANFDMGIYALFLAKKWQNKPQFSELLSRMYFVMNQMEQINEGEETIKTVLERAHKQYSFFDIDREIKDLTDVVRWLSGKFARQFDREAAWYCNLPGTLKLIRTPNDMSPIRISMENFNPPKNGDEATNKWWPVFVDDCRKRTQEYNRLGVSYNERIFYSDQDLDDLPFVIDSD